MKATDREEGTKSGLSRRDLLKGAIGVTAAAGLLGATRTEASAQVKKWNFETDVVVLGAGGGGLMAAVEAATAGAKVVLLESMPVIGGSSVICGGGLTFAGTDFQQEHGYKDSNELLYKDLMHVGKNRNVPEMVKIYVNNQLDTYKRLKQLGLKFLIITSAEGSVPRMHQMKPTEMIGILKKEADRLGVRTMMETAGSELVTGPTGRIIGVKASRGGKEMTIRAKKGVVVATGGFSNNPGMLENFRINFSKVKSMAGLGSKGDGIKMLWKQGAYMVDLPSIKATYSVAAKSKPGDMMMGTMYRQGAIIVNKTGKRFVNESIGHKDIPEFVLAQQDAAAFMVYDSRIAPEAVKARGTITLKDLERWSVKGDTIEQVAAAAGLPVQTVKETVERYNGFVAAGKDTDFGRAALTGPIGKMVKIEAPPFYIFEGVSAILGTYCGALTNDRAQVLDVYGRVIPGLYAAGEVLGGVHGDGYIGGTAMGKALIFGRLAGRYVATEKA